MKISFTGKCVVSIMKSCGYTGTSAILSGWGGGEAGGRVGGDSTLPEGSVVSHEGLSLFSPPCLLESSSPVSFSLFTFNALPLSKLLSSVPPKYALECPHCPWIEIAPEPIQPQGSYHESGQSKGQLLPKFLTDRWHNTIPIALIIYILKFTTAKPQKN